ncbi:HIT family protein [Streptomyces sp. NEAU-Y11]|uniref:HIT family protein n=1 Tax=Streptomyces cucumeris TaxID=2962890 RepID=UPI0020C93485|nr:HIT family protein [Streptomyces sp. NEAU-Y11]MCP9209647.1 HIT family protein [Streptomyces sp. NEAU-Y11]
MPEGEEIACGSCETIIWPEPCTFCEIVAGQRAAEWVLMPNYWPDAVAFLSKNPLTENHTLVVPKVHVRDFAANPDVSATVMKRASELMQFSPRPMVLFSLRGKEAGQRVAHLHLNLVPWSARSDRAGQMVRAFS